MKPFSVLGVDLSYTSTGLAHIHGDPSDRTLWTIGTKPDHGGLLIGRAAYIGDQIRDEANARMVDVVAIEAPGFQAARSQGQPHNTGMLHGIVRYLLDEGNLEVRLIPPNVWRKVLFDHGSLKKDQVRLEVYKKFGLEGAVLDAIEAYCVAHTAWLIEQPEDEMPKYSVDAIRNWLFPTVKKKRKKEA